MGAHRLRVLHVSDLQVVDPAKDRHRRRRGLVLGEAWDANLAAATARRSASAISLARATVARGKRLDGCAGIVSGPEAARIRAIQHRHNLT